MRRGAVVLFLAVAACGAPSYEAASTQVLVDPSVTRREYFGSPWPDDRRLTEAGALDTLDFPNPQRGALFETVLSTSHELVRGWGLSAPVFLPFSGAIDVTSLPATPAAAMGAQASVYLVAVDEASPAYGRRLPLEWRWFPEKTSFLPGHVLAVRPSVGFPLEERTRYALVVTTAVRDAHGEAVGPQESLWNALQPGADDPYWKPLAAYLARSGLAPDTVAGATLFTTQDATGELLVLRDAALAAPAPAVKSLSFVSTADGFTHFTGTFEAPNYQHGTPPYENAGGEFRFDDAGKPLVGQVETLRLTICVPAGDVPAQGFPVVLYSHGTGGDYRSVIDDETCKLLAAKGLAVFSMDQVLHGPRAPANALCHTQPVENCFFNLVNGRAGRATIRQSALDNLFLRRLATSTVIDASVDTFGRTVTFDGRHPAFFGHSQGGLTGALYAAIDPEIAGVALSAGGGHLTTSILERDDGALKDLAESSLFLDLKSVGESLDQFHPAVALIQTLGEAADPLSWSRMWIDRPQGRRKHVYLTSGWLDDATPAASTEAMAASAGVPQLDFGHRDSVAHGLHGLSPLAAPLSGNIPARGDLPAVTAGLQQFPAYGHFPIFEVPAARVQLSTFLSDVTAGRLPVIPRQ